MRNLAPNPLINEWYKGDRLAMLAYKPLEEWLTSSALDYDYPDNMFYKKANEYFVKAFYSMFNYVTNEKSPNFKINVDSFSSFNGITTNIIQLGTKPLAIVSLSQQEKVDALYGIMLHEMFHKRYTNRDIIDNFLQPFIRTPEDMYKRSVKKDKIVEKLLKTNIEKKIFNILEDFRIESMGIKEFPGFIFYFDNTRKLAYEIQSSREPIVDHEVAELLIDYLIFKVLMPELIEPFKLYVEDTYACAVKKPTVTIEKLKKVFADFDNYIDTNKKLVYSENIVELLKATEEIAKLIPKILYNKLKSDKGIPCACEGTDGNVGVKIEADYETYVPGAEDSIEEALEEMNKNASSIEKETKKDTRIDKLDDDYGIYETATVTLVKKGEVNNEILTQAISLSQNIAKNLAFLSSRLNAYNRMYEQTEGELDEDELHSIGYNKLIFYEDEEKPGFDFDLGILVDQSGSMAGGSKKKQATIAALACALATKDVDYVNLFVYGHSQGRSPLQRSIDIFEYYNTKTGLRDWERIFSIDAMCGNADGYAIQKMGEIMLNSSKSPNKILLVISDGMPAAQQYGGPKAEAHVWSVTEGLAKKGIDVIQICIDNVERSAFMFRNFIPFDNMDKFVEEFRKLLERKMIAFSNNL